MSEHLSDLDLDALRIGAGRDELRAHLESCPACQARQASLTAAADDFAARFNPAGLAAQTLEATGARPHRAAWWPALGLVAAAGLVVGVWPRPDEVRAKGGAEAVELHVKAPGGVTRVRGPVPRDAALGVRVHVDAPASVRVLWMTPPETWQALYPPAERPAWPVEAPTWLPHALKLDGAPQTEQLGVVICDAAVAHPEAVHVLEGQRRAGCRAEVLEVAKQ